MRKAASLASPPVDSSRTRSSAPGAMLASLSARSITGRDSNWL
jgi:hypothetical protein